LSLKLSVVSPDRSIIFGKRSTARSGAQRCFEFVFRPTSLRHRTALRELEHYHDLINWL
jgi:hypothetical protein